jgi:predicted transcriptional regulator
MRRSKLDLHVAVLKAVDIHGPLNITGLTLRVRLNYVQLKPILKNLINKGTIQEQHLRNGSTVYAATPLGQRLSTQFKQIDESKTALTIEAKQTISQC